MVSVYKLQSDQIKFWSIISEGNKYFVSSWYIAWTQSNDCCRFDCKDWLSQSLEGLRILEDHAKFLMLNNIMHEILLFEVQNKCLNHASLKKLKTYYTALCIRMLPEEYLPTKEGY